MGIFLRIFVLQLNLEMLTHHILVAPFAKADNQRDGHKFKEKAALQFLTTRLKWRREDTVNFFPLAFPNCKLPIRRV
ncbi:hypothetical protein C5Y97_15665 [Blastopirellula marina]|uniref:Uncharacterized protein n=1 Tax=Blastopirellula marina TaxID=124 RepID=A0A2S8FNA6_9BACT|nr:hypothetical protein C5Y98_15655 [Blastopirellula marina]PTL43458.1 hypothetical protein C5Y97_15665 [Blastopirellula marina]